MENKQHKNGLSASVMRMMIVLFVILTAIIVFVGFRLMSDMLMNMYSTNAQEIAAFETTQIDGDSIEKYHRTHEKDEYYDEVMQQMNSLKESLDELAYLYVFVPYEDHFEYIWDAYREGEDMDNISSLGDIYEYADMEYKYLVPDVLAGRASDQMINGEDVGFGTSVSAWCPIFNSDGELVAMAEADYRIEDLAYIILRNVAPIAAILVIALLTLLALVLYFLRKRVTAPISLLTEYVNSYQSGEKERVSFTYDKDDEIQWLGKSFDEMSERIERYIDEVTRVTAERERIGAELDVATHIQKSMLPNIFPRFCDNSEFRIYATMDPAKEVGGDFYDFFMVDDRHLAIVMADVSGKGVPAALFMVIGKTLINDHTQPERPLGEVFTEVNNILCDSNSEGLFITAFEGVLDLETGDLEFVNAGHEMPFIMKADGSFEAFKIRPGFVLAGMEGIRYRSGHIKLEPGDRIFQYTDGVTEATSAELELFGMDRLYKSLNDHRQLLPNELLPAVKQDIDTFVGDAPQFDDITMLCLDYLGK